MQNLNFFPSMQNSKTKISGIIQSCSGFTKQVPSSSFQSTRLLLFGLFCTAYTHTCTRVYTCAHAQTSSMLASGYWDCPFLLVQLSSFSLLSSVSLVLCFQIFICFFPLSQILLGTRPMHCAGCSVYIMRILPAWRAGLDVLLGESGWGRTGGSMPPVSRWISYFAQTPCF